MIVSLLEFIDSVMYVSVSRKIHWSPEEAAARTSSKRSGETPIVLSGSFRCWCAAPDSRRD